MSHPDDPRTAERRTAAAAGKLAARRRRVRRIRGRVAGLSLAGMLAASGGVLVQLVTGHDPSLAARAAADTATGSGSGTTTAAGSRSGATTVAAVTGTARTRARTGRATHRSRHAASTPSTVTTHAS